MSSPYLQAILETLVRDGLFQSRAAKSLERLQ